MNHKNQSINEILQGTYLLLDKPLGWTSFDVVGKVRRILRKLNDGKKLKIGHAGTLDPLATGLLILCTGSFTKKINEFQEFEKEYTGTMILGATTPSYDLETEISERTDISHIDEQSIREVSKLFIGEQDQMPPVYSAVKIDGRRAYDYARAGDDVVIKTRTVNIKEFEITGINMPEISFRLVVSKGTYVRSLVRDFGEKLKCGAYLSSLCRTGIGDFHLSEAVSPLEIEEFFSDNNNTDNNTVKTSA